MEPAIINKAIAIGIEKTTLINEMSKVIKLGGTKEDTLYVLREMLVEIDQGIIKIDQLIDDPK